MAKNFNKPKHKKKSDIARSIESLKIDHTELCSFSFKYFQVVPEKFDPRNRKGEYFLVLLDRLKALSFMKITEFYSNRSSALRAHPIDWRDTTEKSFNLKKEDQFVSTPYQFELTANEYGRVHGFFIGSVFYIRWFDPDHKLYPSK